MRIINLDQIKLALHNVNLIKKVEPAFVAYSNNETVVPPVGELVFENPPGDTHIKYGYLKNSEYYLIKIASGFYDNPQKGLSSSQGMMLLFDKNTGVPVCLLQDEGYLTNVRTAIAGAIAAQYCAPKSVHAIGIIGTGLQAQFQLEHLLPVVDCDQVYVYGRNAQKLAQFIDQFANHRVNTHAVDNVFDVTHNCNVIVTTTPVRQPLLTNNMIQPGTHITAVGSDTPEKNELDPNILAAANVVVTDCYTQAQRCGEIFHALNKTNLKLEQVIELGEIIKSGRSPRQSNQDITVVDLTGIAPLDIAIAELVWQQLASYDKIGS